jgi:hypothetical protein
VKFRTYGQKKSVLQRFSSSLVDSADRYFEERAAFGRFGL